MSFTAILVSLLGCRGCSKNTDRKYRMENDLATRGIIYVAADESYKYILDEEKQVFEYIYPSAEIHIIYSDEKTAFENAIADSVRLVVASTADNNLMDSYLQKRNIKKRVLAVGRDAVVVITNKNNRVKKLQLRHLIAIVSGKITNWKQVADSLPDKPIHVMYDSERSGLARYMAQNYLGGSGTLTGKAADSTFQLIQQVESDEGAIGLIGFNFISDYHDKRTYELANRVKVLQMSELRDTIKYCFPSQTTVADSTYPLIRRMMIINKEGKMGLGTGFVSFIAGPKGQRIMLKAGIVPQWIPTREIEIVH
jgi:phosphate transport system substrate-binding protein